MDDFASQVGSRLEDLDNSTYRVFYTSNIVLRVDRFKSRKKVKNFNSLSPQTEISLYFLLSVYLDDFLFANLCSWIRIVYTLINL